MTIDTHPARITLTLTCPDRPGIVHAVTGYFLARGGDIAESQQYGDPDSGRFFMRVEVRLPQGLRSLQELRAEFEPLADSLSMQWTLADTGARTRVAILVSKFDHCLNDLLFRWRSGHLSIDVPVVVSNHRDLQPLVESYGVEFVHLPVTPDTKPAAEAALADLVDDREIELVVLARYMQVLSDDLCRRLAGRAINIHHSFLPSFKGAKPYHQAHARGVKLVGATAHYVTADLDEGPIIEQQVIRVDHATSVEQLTVAGRDAEALALARAVQWHAQGRVLLNGGSTIVLR
ncbi:formyltetrahydrofolate deformylase [Agromyces silvae]|uniref:formyltetrahydrofolate deformylase n=1 Tax=Agromyces silvae TaxID=3388266 RepID=UPI00280ABDAB|nr:formyltetrahydrofolate deformylase [Agromyces protaetiae]